MAIQIDARLAPVVHEIVQGTTLELGLSTFNASNLAIDLLIEALEKELAIEVNEIQTWIDVLIWAVQNEKRMPKEQAEAIIRPALEYWESDPESHLPPRR